LRFHTTI